MIVKCNLHQSAPRLAEYLITQAGNERVELVANHGGMFTGLTPDDYRMSAKEMQMRFDATSATYPCYHVQLSPGKDEALTPSQVQRTIDIYLQERRLTGRPHLATVHYKGDGMHIHLQISRIDPATGKADKNKMWRDDNDRARSRMELEFNHRRTPQENPRRKDIKRHMTGLYAEAKTPQQFVMGANKLGYAVAYGGSKSHPWQLVDSMAVGHNLSSLITVPVEGKEKKLTNKQLIDYFRGIRFPNLTEAIGLQRATMNDRIASEKAAEAEMKRAKHFQVKEQLNYSPDSRKPRIRMEVGKPAAEKKPDTDLIEQLLQKNAEKQLLDKRAEAKSLSEKVETSKSTLSGEYQKSKPEVVEADTVKKPRYRIRADAMPQPDTGGNSLSRRDGPSQTQEVADDSTAKKPVSEKQNSSALIDERQDAWQQAIDKAKRERFTKAAEGFAEGAGQIGGKADIYITNQNDKPAGKEPILTDEERLKAERERLLKETADTLENIFTRKRGKGLSL